MGVDITARLVYGYKLNSKKLTGTHIDRDSLIILENSPCDFILENHYCDLEYSDLYFGISYENEITGAGLLEIEKVRKQEVIDLMAKMYGLDWAEYLDEDEGLDPKFHLFTEMW